MTERTTVFDRIYRKFFVHWYWFAGITAVLLVLAFVYLRNARPVYQITATLLILNEQNTGNENKLLEELNISDRPKKIETEQLMFKSRPLIGKVVDDLKLWSADRDREQVIDRYTDLLEVNLPDKKAPVIELGIRDNDALRGKKFLDELINEYTHQNAEQKNNLTRNMLDFIDARLLSLSGELSVAEKDIEGYKSSRGFTDFSSESNIYLQNAQNNDEKLNMVNVQLKVIENIGKYISEPKKTASAPSTIGIDDPALTGLVEQLARLQMERNKLLATAPEGNYLFKPLDRQIEAAVAAINENVKSIRSSLLSMRKGLLQVNSRVKTSIRNLPGQELGYVSIKRQQSIKENLYTYLLQKREEAALRYASALNDINVINRPYVEGTVWPKKPLVYLLAAMLGVALTAGFLFVKELLSRKVTSRAEVEEALDARVLNEVSYIDTPTALVVPDKPDTEVAEQFRTLRTNLHQLHNSREKGRVTLITSGGSGEGKSFIAVNLAASLAASGRKTLLVDVDLRKSRLAEILDLPDRHAGMTDYLKGQSAASGIIQTMKNIPHLDVITAGHAVTNASEILESSRLDDLILQLKKDYDDIILYSPPSRIVNDSLIVSRFSDVSLYVVRKNKTRKSELSFIRSLFMQQKLPAMNVVFNCARKSTGEVIY